jgi:hypothetical protein
MSFLAEKFWAEKNWAEWLIGPKNANWPVHLSWFRPFSAQTTFGPFDYSAQRSTTTTNKDIFRDINFKKIMKVLPFLHYNLW